MHVAREDVRRPLGDELAGHARTARCPAVPDQCRGSDLDERAAIDQHGEPLPVEFAGRVIYYVGPVDPVGEEVVGPAGPTTATRMDKFTRMMLDQGLLAMVGKAERGPAATEAIREAKSAYLMAVGGAAYLVARAIKGSKVVGFEDLGMEAIYEFEVSDFPVTVAVDSEGQNVHQLAPLVWRDKIAKAARALEPAE